MQIADVRKTRSDRKTRWRGVRLKNNQKTDRRGGATAVTLATPAAETRKKKSFRQFYTDVSHQQANGCFGHLAFNMFIYTLRTRTTSLTWSVSEGFTRSCLFWLCFPSCLSQFKKKEKKKDATAKITSRNNVLLVVIPLRLSFVPCSEYRPQTFFFFFLWPTCGLEVQSLFLSAALC